MSDVAMPADGLSPLDTARFLHAELELNGISSEVHAGYGLALVSVVVGLVVWCDGDRFWWRTGWDDRRERFTYAWHPAIEPARAARRIAFRYEDLHDAHPSSGVTAEGARCFHSKSA
ncbi:hypothetical protein ACFYSC_18315 [Streptosporangium sp. NPDC004379]|uniref:hypothetical protein n=1 Tax=Streptosporangium sp. NPDC004379 TaxID=3366189 RepID=UPI0036A7B1FA